MNTHVHNMAHAKKEKGKKKNTTTVCCAGFDAVPLSPQQEFCSQETRRGVSDSNEVLL